jgi:hypothetical protein
LKVKKNTVVTKETPAAPCVAGVSSVGLSGKIR